jgi:spore coat protein A, manganese oxidase
MITRRDFLKLSAAAWASTFVSGRWFSGRVLAMAGPGIASWQTQSLSKWVDPLPIMPVAVPPALGGGLEIPDPVQPGKMADFYAMQCIESEWQFHSDLPPARANSYSYAGTKLEYEGVGAPISGYLGPSIVALKGKAVVLDMANKLPLTPLYADAYDTTLGHDGHAAMYPNTSRIAVHLHGGFVPPQFDGHPDSWFGPDGSQGMRYDSLPGAPANGARYWYPNLQGPCLLWYHDHSMFQTRLNPFAGQAAGYVIIDGDDTVVPGMGGLNVPKFPYDVPLVIQDRTFCDDGSMFYPTASGQPEGYPHPVWQPEYFGDTPVVNGKAYPFLEVEPRRYRLRVLNGSQARVYELSLGLPMWLIGTEQGLLRRPVKMNKIVLAGAERADVIVDFAGFQGQEIPLRNTANAPYPNGEDVAIPELMLFRVKSGSITDTTADPAKGELKLPAFKGIQNPRPNMPVRDWVLKEAFDPFTGEPSDVKVNGLWFDEPVEDFPQEGSTEVWNYVNLTEDAHPMHPHLIKFQVYGRVPLDVGRYEGDWLTWIAAGRNPLTKPKALDYATGPRQGPAKDEIGWKDTVKASVGMITQIVGKFDVPPGSETGMSGGYEYVHHCHILEHEENEMMRPFTVLP